MEGKDVIAPELHEQKLRAALDARADGDTLIVARTDAIAVTGLEDAIARARRYADAGADVIFVDAPRSEEELRAIGSAGIGKPLLVNVSEYGRTPDLGAKAFEELGFSIALYPTSTLFAASQSTKELAASLRETGSTRAIVPRMMPFDELNETLGKDDWDVIP
jgi:2-methylisocitrate lyase-like PEP mutase family enzyme